MQQDTELTWTGERFIPGIPGENAFEHLHRYALACRLSAGKRVLDVACGEGYGTSLLANSAASAVGVDIDGEAVAHARAKYGRPNLTFLKGDCTALPLPDSSIDLAVSFETLEHHAKHDAMLADIRRVLAPDGILLISTPDRLHYSDKRQYANPFHVLELYAEDFRHLVFRHFPCAHFYGQRVVYGSLIVAQHGGGPFYSYFGDSVAMSGSEGLTAPFYFLAVAGTGALPILPGSLFDGTSSWKGENPSVIYELVETKRQLAAVYESIYWRMTYPVRMLRKLAKQVLGV